MVARETRTPRLLLALAALALWLVSGTAQASRLRALNLEEMTRRADRIVAGRCVGLRSTVDPALGVRVTEATFVVSRTLKGQDRRALTIRLLGDQDALTAGTSGPDGMARYHEGEEVVVFLYGESRSGLTSAVGLGQGKFTIVRDKEGRRVATNAFNNETLLNGLPESVRQRFDEDRPGRSPGAVPEDVLLEVVDDLVRGAP